MALHDDDAADRKAHDAIALYFVGDSTMGEALTKLCAAALEAVPRSVMAGISMTVDARIGTYVFTHSDVVEIDQAQYATGHGPCVDAFSTGKVVRVDSMRRPGPYPEFRKSAEAHGLLSVLSLPMRTADRLVGALNLYARSEDAFDDTSAAEGLAFATQAAYLLLNHQAYWDARSLSENLQQAMASRAEIEQAKGIIIASTGCTPDEAFAQLRQQSQHENVKLRDIAHQIVRQAQRAARR